MVKFLRFKVSAIGFKVDDMKLSKFAKYSWFVLGFNLLVILWGAYVRASSSGAGCGSHWPLCNGEMIPQAPTIKTVVEFSHRLTSGVALLMVVVMVIWAFRAYERGHDARKGAALSMIFMITEALVGAGLVLLEYVAENKSMWRAAWISGHLINTFILVAMLTLTAWAATTSERLKIRDQGNITVIYGIAILATLLLGISGAISALGITLFPVQSIAEGIRQDFSPFANQLTRLRIVHPGISIIVSLLLIYTARQVVSWRPGDWTVKIYHALAVLICTQLVAGSVNLLLHAPIWLQIVHLLLSDLIWITLMLMVFNTLTERAWRQAFATDISATL